MKHMSNKYFCDIQCGGYHTLALTSKAKVFAWGKNKCDSAPPILIAAYYLNALTVY